LDVPLTSALRFASLYPAMFIGLGDMLGRVARGYRADMVAFYPDDVGILATWVAGASQAESLEPGSELHRPSVRQAR
jgi:N-acetylglucosamine-6-phosphate deacetylase